MKTIDRHRLAQLEGIIERGLQTFVEVGHALAEIRDSRLYLEHSPTFEAYCKSRWGWKKSQAYRLMNAAEVTDRISPIGDNAPTNEAQVRPLTKLDPKEQPAAWQRATEAAAEAGEPLTARHVEAIVAEMPNRITTTIRRPPHRDPARVVSNAVESIANVVDLIARLEGGRAGQRLLPTGVVGKPRAIPNQDFTVHHRVPRDDHQRRPTVTSSSSHRDSRRPVTGRAPRRSRAFWVIPAQPVQELYGAQGDAPDPIAGSVLMALISAMAMNHGFGGLPAYHVSISQRELATRTGRSRKVVREALERLEKRAHCTAIKVPSDGQRRGPNARIVYRIDLLMDRTTAFHGRGPSASPSKGPGSEKKGPFCIQKEISDREQTTTPRSRAARPTSPPGDESESLTTNGTHPAREWARPYYEAWTSRFGGRPNVGLLRKKVEPLERVDGRDMTVRRWRHMVAGLNPRFFGRGDPFAAAVLRFAGAPAAYDDEDWHLSDRERAEYARLTEGL